MASVVQMTYASTGKFTTTSSIPWDDTIPQNTEGLEVMDVAFTPQHADSLIIIEVRGLASRNGTYALFKDSGADAIGARSTSVSSSCEDSTTLTHSETSGSTTTRNYKLRVGADSVNTYQNYNATTDDSGGVGAFVSMVITEYKQSAPDTVVRQVSRASSGKVASTTVMPADDTIPQNTEGTECCTLAITPELATSKLIIEVNSIFFASSNDHVTLALFQDSEANALAACAYDYRANHIRNLGFTHCEDALTTTARTYKVRLGAGTTQSLTNHWPTSDDSGGVLDMTNIKITEVL